jgi:hypothetical protein
MQNSNHHPDQAHASINPASRPISVPQHILGNIIKMGFSIQQVHVALTSTDSRLDIEAALKTLILNGTAGACPQLQTPPDGPRSVMQLMSEREREEDVPSPAA